MDEQPNDNRPHIPTWVWILTIFAVILGLQLWLSGRFSGPEQISLPVSYTHLLQAVNHAWIRRGPPTALTDLYLAATGATDAMDLMEGLSFDRYHLRGELAVAVFRAADAGDAVAADIIRWAGEELGWLAVAVIRQLDLQDLSLIHI